MMKGACKWAQRYGPLIGRLLLANLFIVSGFKKITGFAASAGYMAAKMPALDPNLINTMLVLTIAIELGGGLMILVGWQARWAAAIIFTGRETNTRDRRPWVPSNAFHRQSRVCPG